MVFDMAAAGAYTVILGSGAPLWMGATMHLRVQPSNISGFCCTEGTAMAWANAFPIHETGLDYDHFPSAGMGKRSKVNAR